MMLSSLKNKFEEMANKHNISNINNNTEFIQTIRDKDESVGGVDLLENFEKVKDLVNMYK